MPIPLQSYYTSIYKTYDLVNKLFTFGLDKKWRNDTVNECLSYKPSRVLDLCCGTGDIAIRIKKAATERIQVKGYDLNSNMLALAIDKSKKIHTDIDFIQGDVACMPFINEEFDCITIGFGFRNLTWENNEKEKYLSEIHRILKTEGKLLILESAVPENIIIGFFYKVYLKFILIPLGGFLSGDWDAYRYLANSSKDFYRFSELKKLLASFNFDLQLKRSYLFGSVNLLVATRIKV